MSIYFEILLLLVFFLFVSIGMRWWAEYLDWFVLRVEPDAKTKQIMNEPSYPLIQALIRYIVAFSAYIFFIWVLPLTGNFGTDVLILFDFFAVVVGSFLGAMYWFISSYIIDKNWHRKLGHEGAKKRICYEVSHPHMTAKQAHIVDAMLWGGVIFLLAVSLMIWLPMVITA